MDFPFLHRAFRTGRSCELVVADRLSPEERKALGERLAEPSLFGVLKYGVRGSAKIVDRDAALLLFTLREPGPLPAFVRSEMEPETLYRWVRGLLAAGILELEHEGEFLAGDSALLHLGAADPSSAPGSPAAISRIGRVSRSALEMAARIPGATHSTRARWLYGYNRQPATPVLQSGLRTESAIVEWLGLRGETGARLDAGGARTTGEAWISWTFDRMQGQFTTALTYKLYVSPRLTDVPLALGRLAVHLDRLEILHLKIGRDLAALLRPDKLMLYFADLDTLSAAADVLRDVLADLEPQGVPFTAEIGLDGLLSWGADPPLGRDPSSPRRSWRQWITERLAAGFDEIPAASGEALPRWRQVIDLLAIEGVDTETWAPDPIRWLGLETNA